MQEVTADRIVVALDVDALAGMAVVIPITSIEPRLAIRRSAMSRAPAGL
jgi:hypothetical protein